jgi:hypothetical protein
MMPAVTAGLILFALVTVVNYVAIQRKVKSVFFCQ